METVLCSKPEAWSAETLETVWLKWVRLAVLALTFFTVWLAWFTLQVMTSYVLVVFHRAVHMQRLSVTQLPAR